MSAAIDTLAAYIKIGETEAEIGQLRSHNKAIYFKYDSDFLDRDLELSPFKMKRTSQIITPTEPFFDGLFGVFADSMPDGWGRLLLDRKLIGLGKITQDTQKMIRTELNRSTR